MKGGETVVLQNLGNISFHNHNVLDVVTNGMGHFLCVRANDNEDVHDTQYWMVIAKGRDGRDGTNADVSISDHDTWVINGKDTGKAIPIPSFATKTISDNTDLNTLTTNGAYYGNLGNAKNGPSEQSGSFILRVAGTKWDGMQELVKTPDATTWVRSWHDSGTWTDWRQITQWN